MKRLKISPDFPFGVNWHSGRRVSKRWISVHKTRSSAERSALLAGDKYPTKTFEVWEWWPHMKAAFPVKA